MPESATFTPFMFAFCSVKLVQKPYKPYAKYLRFQNLNSYLLKRKQHHQYKLFKGTHGQKCLNLYKPFISITQTKHK